MPNLSSLLSLCNSTFSLSLTALIESQVSPTQTSVTAKTTTTRIPRKCSFQTRQNPYTGSWIYTLFNTIMTIRKLCFVGFLWSAYFSWNAVAFLERVLYWSVSRCSRLGILLNLETPWRCSVSSFIGSHPTGFWRYLKGFMVCFFRLVYMKFGHLRAED